MPSTSTPWPPPTSDTSAGPGSSPRSWPGSSDGTEQGAGRRHHTGCRRPPRGRTADRSPRPPAAPPSRRPARHHPERPVTFATCHSWLLDRTFADHLRPDATIVNFRRRFTRHGDRPLCDSDVLEFVFDAPPGTTEITGLPRRSTLQRAPLDHLEHGRHWSMERGWMRLP
ncbi:hypothetical protein [Streptomyces luteocolor]|uniref:hypothetical protein n=1 Tax=Streptomyces luteocolor TaxID=285500 RepID=UPI001300CE10|nr:hypothetical protein [Streptomyces luteocolor]